MPNPRFLISVLALALSACSGTRPDRDAGSAPAPQPPATTVTSSRGGLPDALFDPAALLPAPETEYRGANALGLALRRLGPTQRVLMIGAHPDDENTAILAELALGEGADVAYLSLTRGEGGQNLIGPELEEALGLIRTEELLAARRLDGAVQFFTRAYDFGFSRTAEEAFEHWPRDSVLADVVAVVRTWRPDVIVSQFTGTPRDGHGHHQAAGILAREAYTAAADPARFPQQLAAGLRAHTTARFYQSWFRAPDDTAGVVRLQTGALDPLLGRSRFQIAMASRSRHRSQDMGRAESMGPQTSMLSAVAPGPEIDFPEFSHDLDSTLWQRMESAALDRDDPAYRAGDFLRSYDAVVADARRSFLLESADLPGTLINVVELIDRAYAATTDPDLRFHIAAERADAARAAVLALGVQLDVTADRRQTFPGDTISLELALWNGGSDTLRVQRLEPDVPEGWWAESDDETVRAVAPGEVARRTFRVHLPPDAPVDVPYFLAQPRASDSDMYEWPADYNVRGRPFERPLLRGRALIANALPIEDAAEHVEIDPARGELREPVLVLPGHAIGVDPATIALPLDRQGRPQVAQPHFGLTERFVGGAFHSDRQWTAPAGWEAHNYGGAQGADTGEELRWGAWFTPPAIVAPGDYRIRVAGADERGQALPANYDIVDYPHTRPRIVPEQQELLVRAFPVEVPRAVRVGYIAGSGDDAPAAIAALGVGVDTLTIDDITGGLDAPARISEYDVVVFGVRAYEVTPGLGVRWARDALERYVRAGGVVIVQYNKYEFAEQGMALLPITMSRPHDRVTDETAPVRLLEPSHPILSAPNRIGPADFEGWVQERGLYFARTWDDAYSPLLEMADPGQTPTRGSLLAARIGEGWYVYTGLALFRQLPAGVPGAYRLLANLLALGADRP